MNVQSETSAPSLLEAGASKETVFDNPLWKRQPSQLISILVPNYKDDPTPLLRALDACDQSNKIELIVFDDGSENTGLIERLSDTSSELTYPIRIVSAVKNLGRSGARNRLLNHARCTWVLLLDSDMLPDGNDFLSNYISEIDNNPTPKLVVGGFSLQQATISSEFALHRWQAEQSECVPAEIRSTEPGRYVFTSNVLAHAELFEEIPFDESFQGWGWEDVDWGLRIAQSYPVIHLDNTATHLGLDNIHTLMRKYGASGPNFKKAIEKHPNELKSTSLFKAANALSSLPFKTLFKSISGWIISAKFLPLPVSIKGRVLKLWRALVYAEALND